MLCWRVNNAVCHNDNTETAHLTGGSGGRHLWRLLGNYSPRRHGVELAFQKSIEEGVLGS